ncbi:MAG: ABC transporter permease [Burkholderiaceae bacterium]
MTSNQVAPRTSPQFDAYLRKEKTRKTAILATQLSLLAVFFGAWELFPRMGWVNPLFTSYPSAIWPTFISLLKDGSLLGHTWSTVFVTIMGFALSMTIGIIVAALLWWSSFANKVLDPFLVLANAMPKTAFVPIFYVWLGSTYSIYGIAIAIAVFITIMMIYNGFRNIDPNKVKLLHTFGATRWQILMKVIIPGSVPTLIATLKISFGLSLVGVIVGEFQSANSGLGYLILYGSQIFQFNLVMTAVTVLAIISGLIYILIFHLEKEVMRRYG